MEPNFVIAARSVATAPGRKEDLVEDFYDTHACVGLQRVRRALRVMTGMCVAIPSKLNGRSAPKIVAPARRV